MNNKRHCLLCLALMVFACLSTAQEIYEAPTAKKIEQINILHGDTTVDNYHWMHDKYNTDFVNYLYAENAYADRMMKGSELLQKKIYEEYRKNIRDNFLTKPYKKDRFYYYTRYEKDKEFALYCRKKDSLTAKEEVYLDVNKISEDYLFAQLQFAQVSPNHKLLAFGLNTEGGDAAYLQIKNLETGEIYPDQIKKVAGFQWTGNSKTFYYQLENRKTKRANTIYRHTLGDNVKNDTLIYRETNPSIDLTISKSGEYLFLDRGAFTENEVLYLHENTPFGLFERFEPIEKGVEYRLRHYKQEDCFYIHTNWKAPNGCFLRAPIKPTQKKKWETIIPARDSVILSYVLVKNNYYILKERINGESQLRIINRKTGESTFIKPKLDVYTLGVGKTFDYDTCYFRYYYSSFMQPEKTFTHYLKKQVDSVFIDTFEQKYDVNPENYITKRLWAPTKDGKKVPMDIVYKKDLEINAQTPVYMYAYACYGSIEAPYFNYNLKTILDRGFIYVLAHPRGESILGKQWHEDGRLLKKINTYTDIIACCEYLINENYTSKGKIAIRGGSAGGMLVGSVVTMRPDIFGAGIAQVPFVDVLNQMQDTLWPNIISHFDEIGNPFKKDEYDAIKEYCPYQNTTSKAYPNILVTSGYNDSRVPIWSPAKWVAKLRAHKKDSTELLFKTNMDGGHGRAPGRFAALKEEAFVMAFIMKSLGIEENYIEVKGEAVDKDGSPVQFANVYLKGTTHGTCTNFDGEFLLEIRKGQPQEIVFQAIGFSKKIVPLDLNMRTSELEIQMENEDQYISQVIVTSDGKDPAYGIIKNAQKKRKYYLNQVKAYTADIYMKGAARLNEIPKKIPKFLRDQAPDSTDIGLVYLSESVARYHYKAPNDYKEEMFASKSAGIQRGYSWNRAQDVLMSFYNNTINLKWYSEREFISPIASSANFYYKYKLVETYNEQDKLVHKIKVIPRRKSDPIFKGFIYINDGTWNIHSLNLTIGKESQIEFVDSLNIKQSHIPVADSIYMPLSMEITDHIKIFKFGVTSKNVGFFNNYKINRKFPEDFFKREVFRVEKGANKKDSVFWEDTRPALLTLEEVKKYHKSDSLTVLRESKTYQDSINKKNNKVTFGKIALLGYDYRNRFKNRNWGFNSIISMVDFNTVDGWSLNFKPYIYKYADSLSIPWFPKWDVAAKLRYSINNTKLYGEAKGTYTFEFFNFQSIRYEGGHITEQYNPDVISPLVNSIYSLSLKENYAKLYEKTYLNLNYGANINTFFRVSAGFEYAHRKALSNTTDYSWSKDDEKSYTSNNPLLPDNDDPAFATHNTLTLNLGIQFFFKRNYSTYPDLRLYHRSNKPVLTLHYKKSVSGLGSSVNYDYADFQVTDKIDFKNFGNSHYKLVVGGFFNTDSMSFIDYKHFNGNQTIFLRNKTLSSFNSLEYYKFSTQKAFFEAHYEHHFDGWVVNKLPLVRKLKFQTLVGVNFLYTEEKKDYTELFFGVENIFNMFRVDFVGQYTQEDKFSPQFRIGMDLDF